MNKIIRHGEVILKLVDTLPSGAEIQNSATDIVVAHSESGHNHILSLKKKVDMSKIKVYTMSGDTYIEVPGISELWHNKTGNEVHKTHSVGKGVYQIILKKEFDYYEGAIKIVRD